MKVSINFYLDELKPQKQYLTMNNLAIAAGVVLLLSILWMGLILTDLNKAQSSASLINQNAQQAQTLLTRLQQDLIKHNDKATFNDKKNKLDKKLTAKNLLWEGVGKRLQTTTIDYYLVMKELTEHHDHDLWLAHFSFDQSMARFRGFTIDSSAVTRWMTYLQNTQSFKGREFSYLHVESTSEDLMKFDVATSIEAISEEVAQ